MNGGFIFIVYFLFFFQKRVKLKAGIKVGAKRSRSFGEWRGRKRGGEGFSFRFVFFKDFSGTVNVFAGRRRKKVRLGRKIGGESNGKRVSSQRGVLESDERALCIGDSDGENSLSADQLFDKREENIKAF